MCQLEQPGFGIACGDGALDLNDGCDMRMPVGIGERAGGVEDGDDAGFVAIAAAVAGLDDVVWAARSGDISGSPPRPVRFEPGAYVNCAAIR